MMHQPLGYCQYHGYWMVDPFFVIGLLLVLAIPVTIWGIIWFKK